MNIDLLYQEFSLTHYESIPDIPIFQRAVIDFLAGVFHLRE